MLGAAVDSQGHPFPPGTSQPSHSVSDSVHSSKLRSIETSACLRYRFACPNSGRTIRPFWLKLTWNPSYYAAPIYSRGSQGRGQMTRLVGPADFVHPHWPPQHLYHDPIAKIVDVQVQYNYNQPTAEEGRKLVEMSSRHALGAPNPKSSQGLPFIVLRKT